MINNGFKVFKNSNDFYYIQEKNSNNKFLGLGDLINLNGSENKIKEFDFFNNNKNNIKKIFMQEEDIFYVDKENNFYATGNFFNTNSFEKINELSRKNIKHIFDINKNFNNVAHNENFNSSLKAGDVMLPVEDGWERFKVDGSLIAKYPQITLCESGRIQIETQSPLGDQICAGTKIKVYGKIREMDSDFYKADSALSVYVTYPPLVTYSLPLMELTENENTFIAEITLDEFLFTGTYDFVAIRGNNKESFSQTVICTIDIFVPNKKSSLNSKIIIEQKEDESVLYNIDQNKNIIIPNWLNISPFQYEINKIKKIKSNGEFIFVLMTSGEFYVYGNNLQYNLKEKNKWNIVKFTDKYINKIIDFDLSDKTCILAAEDFKDNSHIFVAGINDFGQLGTSDNEDCFNFKKIEYLGNKPIKVFALNDNSYIIDKNKDLFFTGKKEMLPGNFSQNINSYEKFNSPYAIENLHFTKDACIIETNQKTFFGFGINNGLLLMDENVGALISDPIELKQIDILDIENFIDYKTEVTEYTKDNDKTKDITTNTITKIKLKYVNNNNGTYCIKYLDTSEIKDKPLLVLSYSEKNKEVFKYVEHDTVFYFDKEYDFKVISLINEKYKNSIGIISFPKIKDSIEIDTSNYTNLKINSELKDIISFEKNENILITDKFKNKPLFFKFLIPEYKNDFFDLIDEENNSIENLIVLEGEKYYCYFNFKNNTKYKYCLYNESELNNKKYKSIKNILKAQYGKTYSDEEKIYFKKDYAQNKIFSAEFMEHFDYDCVYKLPVPSDLLSFKSDIIITNDQNNYKNYFIVDGEFYIYHNKIKEMLNENYLYFEIKNSKININWVKESSGLYSNTILKNRSQQWINFTNQSVYNLTKEFYQNNDENELFYEFKKYCETNKILFNIQNFLFYGFQKINFDFNNASITITESIVKDKTPVWINSSPVKVDMWLDKSFDFLEEDSNFEITFLSNTILNSEIKKVQNDYVLSKELDISNVFASFEIGKRYFKQNNIFVENEYGNIILNEIKNENLIYEPFSKHEKINKSKEIGMLNINSDNKEKFSDYNINFYKDNFKGTSMPLKIKGE